METHAAYLRDLGDLLWREAEAARDGLVGANDYQLGRALGLYEAVSLIEQQAIAFGLSLDDVGLGGRRADDLLHRG